MSTGVYSNIVDIKASLHDYVLTFSHMLPSDQDPQQIDVRAVCRVVISATLLEPLMVALEQAKSNREKMVRSAEEEGQAG
jgi:hypothetical protein